jgi:asparagine synthase (glutamine-hydrolysing)
MANFMIIVDSDPERRAQFMKSVERHLALIGGLAAGQCGTRDFSASWASSSNAPVSQIADNDGAAVIWGEAIISPSAQRQQAAALREVCKNLHDKPPLYDGFYCAVVYRSEAGLLVSADLLGLFPVYYYYTDGVLLIASSPELMQYHPCFRARINPAGLVGLLLTNGLFDGQTLWQGVRRLSAGHALVWQMGKQPVEVEQYALPVSSRYFNLPFSNVLEPIDMALRDAIARHAPLGTRYSLLLSGGLDSRMLGGYLESHGNQVEALTIGLPADIEMQCAARVAHALDFEHHSVLVAPEQYPPCADLAVKWEHLAPGFSMIMGWGSGARLTSLAPRVVAGYLGDAIVGGSHIHWAYSPAERTMSFEAFFDRVNGWGIQPAGLKRLLRREVFDDLVDDTVNRIRSVYENYAEFEFQRAWCFDLHHRQRFHVGCAAWQDSFAAWPALPVSDRQVLEAVGGMPAAAIAERRAQMSLVSSRFPILARLPLDRSSDDDRPLQPRIRQQLAWHFRSQVEPYRRRLARLAGLPQVERRSIYRIMDFDWAGWKATRRHAEPYRECVSDLLVKEELEKLLPPPEADAHPTAVLSGSSGAKILLGLLLFSKEHPR